ncbi:TRAP transporter large permease subunit [Variovorax humicola]|uniref:TRAP transporter large permease subunit n=1 Tax=Variovorax humicola TaxID=1769758 RepID=A0ABU8VVD7_9BURK
MQVPMQLAAQAADWPQRDPVAGRAARLLNGLYAGIAAIAAALIAGEIVLLLASVFWRYALHRPLVWSDEVATVVLIWVGVLGATLAGHGGQHIRMSALVSALPRHRDKFDSVASVATLVTLGALLPVAIEYCFSEWGLSSPALGIPNVVRHAALPVGLALMLVSELERVIRRGAWWHVAAAAVGVAVVTVGLYLFSEQVEALGHWSLLLFFVVLGVLLVTGIPIAFAFAAASALYVLCADGTPMSIVTMRFEEGMAHLILLAIPLFVALGLLLQVTGLAQAMIGFLASLLGRVRGGLNYVLIVAMYVVSGISGSKAADIAAIAPALFPDMKRRGYDEGDMAALLSASAAMSETIPPSLVLITIGSVMGISIAALFKGGLAPALVIAIALWLYVALRARKLPAPSAQQTPPREVGRLFVVALPAFGLPFVIRGAIVNGVATATEVATIGIVYALLAGWLIYRCLDPKKLYPLLVETATTSGAILLIMGTATAMAWVISQSGVSNELAALVKTLPGGRSMFLLVSICVFILVGSLLEGIPAIVLFAPLLFPASRALGIDDVHYSMVVILAMGIGLFAPPIGVGFYLACGMGKVEPGLASRHIWRYLAVVLAGLLVVAFVPQLTLLKV